MKAYGVASKNYTSQIEAKGDTYTQIDGTFPTTNILCKDNPHKQEFIESKYVLDFGCGVGRNLRAVLENTNAVYVGVDPNKTMLSYFWETQKQLGINEDDVKNRVLLFDSLDNIPKDIMFDYVISTFVMQHLGYRYGETYDLDTITDKIKERTHSKAVWFLLEHDSEEDWIERWLLSNNIKLEVFIAGYKGLPELCERDYTTNGSGHHLMIFKA